MSIIAYHMDIENYTRHIFSLIDFLILILNLTLIVMAGYLFATMRHIHSRW